ncbi:MAG: VOC family protein [Lewinellaceae bacterium]|nr:VOC family protein [Lewinellaceae bacterium]
MEGLKRTTVTVMVSNLDTAVSFYTEQLGLKLIKRYGEHYAEIATPGFSIGLHPTSEPIIKGNNLSIGFGVGDLDLNLKRLQAKEIKYRVVQDGPSRLAHFYDQDGNPLYMIEVE